MTGDSLTLQTPSALDVRVYYEDTDAGGVVFYANYLKFLERGRTEWLRRLGVDQTSLAAAERRIFVVKKLDIQYVRPARLDDLLTVHSQLARVGNASMEFFQEARRGAELLCESHVTVVCVDVDTLKPAGLPPPLRTLLKNVQG
jgi:acyl-CoA thioester hydrolase